MSTEDNKIELHDLSDLSRRCVTLMHFKMTIVVKGAGAAETGWQVTDRRR